MLGLVLLSSAAIACAQANPRLASLSIEIWPEFDRPAALVILRAVIGEGVKLPAPIMLRLPAASGGPAAVAYSTSAEGNLLNLKYEQSKAGADIGVKFEAPERFFHVEFYEPIATGDPSRSYRYTWSGDFAVDRATLAVQEPAAAQAVVTDPELKERSTGAGGLDYRTGDLGTLVAGKAVPITIKYAKSDARASVDIKGLRTAQAPPASAPPQAVANETSLPRWLLPMAGFAALSAIAALLVLLVWRRRSAKPSGAYCTKCGAPLGPASNYCGKCGAKVSAA